MRLISFAEFCNLYLGSGDKEIKIGKHLIKLMSINIARCQYFKVKIESQHFTGKFFSSEYVLIVFTLSHIF